MREPTELHCSIVTRHRLSPSSETLHYEVKDNAGNVIAEGGSSTEWYVKHDAGGFHTKEKFDRLYPGGWRVNFDF